MATRCKEGDMAIVTQDQRGCEDNVGRLVRVRGPLLPDRHGRPTWLIFPVTLEPWLYIERNGDRKFAEFQQDDIQHPDIWLRPIRPDAEEAEDALDEVAA